MKRIASLRLSLPTVIALLCGLGLARIFACPAPVLAVDRGESIRTELRALREEVGAVRRDVRRLIELLEGRVGSQDPLRHDESFDAAPDSVRGEVAREAWELTLREAINIVLHHSELFTLVSFGPTTDGPITIYRKTRDVSFTDAEDEALKLVSDVEQAYWGLWVASQNVDTMQAARDTALEVWRDVRAEKEAFGLVAEAHAREQYFVFRGQVEEALTELYAGEKRLRRLLGLAETDGRLIRPVDEPTLSKASFDWDQALAEAHNLPVLKRQRWEVRRAEMEAEAVAVYLSGLERQRWQPQRAEEEAEAMPVPIEVPLGFRKEFAGLRYAQLRLAKERALLQETEFSVGQELAAALRSLDMARVNVQTTHNRRLASEREIEALRERFADRKVSLDALADAQGRKDGATIDYFKSLVDFANALKRVHLKKGSLLRYRNVVFGETARAEPEEDDGDKSD